MNTIELFEEILSTFDKYTIGKSVLFTHSFSIYEPCYIHDKLMAYTLSLRGFDIYATFCDGIQDIECNVYGGVWGGGEKFVDNCKNCQKKSKNLWSFLEDDKIFKYSSYLTHDDYTEVNKIMDSIPVNEWMNYSENEMLFGKWAKDILVNNFVVGDYKIIENNEMLGRNHLKNIILAHRASAKIITTIMPDRIVSNDSYYGMWKMWELLAKKYNIPFYSHWSGTRVGGWCYSHNDASMNLNFSKSWENYSSIPLTEGEKSRVEQWLLDRIGGKEMIIDTASLASFKNEDFDLTKVDIAKPTALLSSNVIWDLAALNKEVFTSNMSEWIVETIRWFEGHPEFQLIIKAHPAELHPSIPETKETVEFIIKKEIKTIPSNVFILSPKVSMSVYELLPIITLGLVFTTSVGMEMAARGMPVITAGKSHYRGYGFTLDPNTNKEYFSILEKVLSGSNAIDIAKTKDLAMKFIKFNFFHYFSKIGLFEFEFSKPVNILVSSLEELKAGTYPHWDYILDCIVEGKPILNQEKWPMES